MREKAEAEARAMRAKGGCSSVRRVGPGAVSCGTCLGWAYVRALGCPARRCRARQVDGLEEMEMIACEEKKYVAAVATDTMKQDFEATEQRVKARRYKRSWGQTGARTSDTGRRCCAHVWLRVSLATVSDCRCCHRIMMVVAVTVIHRAAASWVLWCCWLSLWPWLSATAVCS
jgi:hypothetical protein